MSLRELMVRQRALYDRKNADYGNSFHNTVERFGLAAALVRISDKMERIKRLQANGARVEDESLRDTVSDAVNYLIMLAAELICSVCELADESRVEGESDNVTLVHRLMDNLAQDELLPGEQTDIRQMLELWDDLCEAAITAFADHAPEKTDGLLTVTNYLAGLMALYLLRLPG